MTEKEKGVGDQAHARRAALDKLNEKIEAAGLFDKIPPQVSKESATTDTTPECAPDKP